MKKHLILFILFLVALTGFTQKQEILIGFGPSFPLGSYADKDLSNGDGFADKKGFVNIEFMHEIRDISPFGFFMNFSYQQHNVDDVTLAGQIKLQNPEIASLILDMGNYSSIMGAFGTYYRIEFSDRWRLNLKFGLGIVSLFLDPIKLEYQTYSDDREVINVDTQGEVSFTYYAGFNTEYKLNDNLGVHFNVFHSMADSKISLKDIPSNVETEQTLQYLNVGVGIVIYN